MQKDMPSRLPPPVFLDPSPPFQYSTARRLAELSPAVVEAVQATWGRMGGGGGGTTEEMDLLVMLMESKKQRQKCNLVARLLRATIVSPLFCLPPRLQLLQHRLCFLLHENSNRLFPALPYQWHLYPLPPSSTHPHCLGLPSLNILKGTAFANCRAESMLAGGGANNNHGPSLPSSGTSESSGLRVACSMAAPAEEEVKEAAEQLAEIRRSINAEVERRSSLMEVRHSTSMLRPRPSSLLIPLICAMFTLPFTPRFSPQTCTRFFPSILLSFFPVSPYLPIPERNSSGAACDP